MNITHEDLQKAKRISQEIQLYLEQTNSDDLRSTDLYPMLARKNLVEKDRNNGLHFRAFLKKLLDNHLLNMIPQCKIKYSENKPDSIEWHFYRVKEQPHKNLEGDDKRKIIAPILTDQDIDKLITEAEPHIDKLPKKKPNSFTYPQIELRKLYARAYEIWTDREIEIMVKAYKKFGKLDKVAELLKRQPSVVRKKIEELL